MFSSPQGRRSSRRASRPGFENLEGRQLLVASLAAIPDITVPQTVGYQLPVLGGASDQTYTVTTDNSNVVASVAKGRFLTLNVSHESSGPGDVAFSGPITFQLFEDLTPLTVERISKLVEQGFYSDKIFHRVAPGFPNESSYIVQGGSVNGNGTGDVDQPGFPFQDEFQQQLVFSGEYQLAMANAGRDTNSSQFFVTTGSPRFLDYMHTVFAQLVDGAEIVDQMTQVRRVADSRGDVTEPASPIYIDSATLSDANPNGVIHFDASNAVAGVVTDVTVTATDPADKTTASRTFRVTAIPNVGPDGAPIDERAFLPGLIDTQPVIGPNQSFQFQIDAIDPEGGLLSYAVGGAAGNTSFSPVQNATATVDANGLVTVTPTAGFLGEITILAGARDQTNRINGASIDNPANYDYKRITLTVTNNTGGVRTTGRVLTVTPPARTDKGTNTVVIDQVGPALQVSINGVVNPIRPAASALDRVVIFGAKASDNIIVTPAVDSRLAVTLDGGHGGRNNVQAGSGRTRLHGWFGRNTLTGGPADDILIGRQGHTRFRRSGGTDNLFLGTMPSDGKAPEGTFYRFVGNRLVAVDPAAIARRDAAPPRRAPRGQI